MSTSGRVFFETLARFHELFSVAFGKAQSRCRTGDTLDIRWIVIVIVGVDPSVQPAPVRICQLPVLAIRAAFRRHPVARMREEETNAPPASPAWIHFPPFPTCLDKFNILYAPRESIVQD